jgi:hypothetical protein
MKQKKLKKIKKKALAKKTRAAKRKSAEDLLILQEFIKGYAKNTFSDFLLKSVMGLFTAFIGVPSILDIIPAFVDFYNKNSGTVITTVVLAGFSGLFIGKKKIAEFAADFINKIINYKE